MVRKTIGAFTDGRFAGLTKKDSDRIIHDGLYRMIRMHELREAMPGRKAKRTKANS